VPAGNDGNGFRLAEVLARRVAWGRELVAQSDGVLVFGWVRAERVTEDVAGIVECGQVGLSRGPGAFAGNRCAPAAVASLASLASRSILLMCAKLIRTVVSGNIRVVMAWPLQA